MWRIGGRGGGPGSFWYELLKNPGDRILRDGFFLQKGGFLSKCHKEMIPFEVFQGVPSF